MSKVYRCGCVTKDVGKNLSNTKYMAKWGLLIDDQRCVITLKHSVLSNKKVIWFNDDVVKETKQFLSGDFDYTWSSMKHIFKIVISKEKKNYVYSLFVDDVDFFDLPDFKKKDQIETEDIVNRLKNGPIVSHAEEVEEEEEEEVEEEEEEEEVEEEEEEEVEVEEDEEEVEEENEFFSNRGGDDIWLDFGALPTVTKEESEEDRKKREEEEIKKKRVAEYTASGLVDLNFGF